MKRYKHNLSRWQLLTGDMGSLYPIGLAEALPNDTFQHSTSALIRLSPMAAPVMHPISVRIHHFFIPHRLTWGAIRDDCGQSWEEFITGGPEGDNSDTVPTIATTGVNGDLLDYLGVPPKAGIDVSALPVAAYNLVFNEFFRDADLETEREVSDTSIAQIAWEKDYLTAARPWPQKGPEITLPLQGTAPVGVKGDQTPRNPLGIDYSIDGSRTYGSMLSDQTQVQSDQATLTPDSYRLEADLSQASATNINDVRRAFALQRYQEARSRFGSRYTEYLRYLGVRNPSDARLRRPEFLGGGTVRVAISEVLQTSDTQGTEDPRFGVGDLYGHGVAAVRSNAYRRFIEEHGYILSVMSVRPKAMYPDAIHRTWLRRDKEDFYQRELEFIGQQAVQNNEVFADATTGTQTFGYADRYREYREIPSQVHGEFRNTLNYWHMARELGSVPTLNADFIRCNPSKRIFNEQTTNSLWCMVQHKCVARRILQRSAYGKII